MDKRRKILEFIETLDPQEFDQETQFMLLPAGESAIAYAPTNTTECSNNTLSCSSAINKGTCTNTDQNCDDSTNQGSCVITNVKCPDDGQNPPVLNRSCTNFRC